MIRAYGDQTYTPKLHIGSGVTVTGGFKLLCADSISIGDDTLFGSDVFISDENHGMRSLDDAYAKQPLQTKKVNIGNNCWIGERAIILPGAAIGEWSIIGAGAVVAGNIPPRSIVVGNPGKIIKRFDLDSNEWKRMEEK